ncbi:ATP-binding protein [Neiella marina]|uniref:ATP-binding protein n=1 Tax=Neiella holothuriorum TaxID=2870530 RepID=A0ABS7EET7_9GAMM|nr:AAA family ATPase [Neiella holothuriorum]MBW8190207.1 ATP-binding protein [Neiella holothuriorum]
MEKTNSSQRLAIIMRGLPGSGKSRLAKQMWQQHASQYPRDQIICSTDDYFQHGMRYVFQAELLPKYHSLNLVRFIDGLCAGYPIMICDNTNMACWEYLPYQRAAQSLGYKVKRILVGDPTEQHQQQLCARHNKHQVSLEIIEQMAANFEADQDKPMSPW